MRVAAIQLHVGSDRDDNVARALQLVTEAADRGAEFVVLPEKWSLIGDADVLLEHAEQPDGSSITALRELCRAHGIWCVAGSVAERVPDSDRLRNVSYVIDSGGSIIAEYCKLHMFDVEVGGVAYLESAAKRAGDAIVTCMVANVPVGLSICYDLRFPELYRALTTQGARIITIPAAFTLRTGRDHWEVLVRARAIENQVHVIAPNVIGDHGGGKISYGRSMIVDPWGIVLATAPDADAVITADLDLEFTDVVRAGMPVLKHRRTDVY